MAAKTYLTITSGTEANATIGDIFTGSSVQNFLIKSVNYLRAVMSGDRNASVGCEVTGGDEVSATGTITMSSFAAGDTITVGQIVFTASATPSGAAQFLSTGGDTAVAAAAVAKINAHTSLTKVCTATSSLGVITVTSYKFGLIGNQITLAISAHGSVSAARLAGGANPTVVNALTTYSHL